MTANISGFTVIIWEQSHVLSLARINPAYPQLAASIIAMQNASVSDVLRKMSPCTRTWNGRIEIDKDRHGMVYEPHVSDLGVFESSQELYSVVKLMFFTHLL